MGFFRFWWLVVKTAFSHSLDYTQTFLFLVLIASGIVTLFLPGVTVNAGAWELAVLVLGMIITVRLLMAPYWVWKDERAKYEAAVRSISAKKQKLREFYVKVGPIIARTLPKDIPPEEFDVYVSEADSWLNTTAGWIKENLGEAATARFLDKNDMPYVSYPAAANERHNAILMNLNRFRRNLLQMIESEAWFKG